MGDGRLEIANSRLKLEIGDWRFLSEDWRHEIGD